MRSWVEDHDGERIGGRIGEEWTTCDENPQLLTETLNPRRVTFDPKSPSPERGTLNRKTQSPKPETQSPKRGGNVPCESRRWRLGAWRHS
eukprot:1334288-Rhodomonas_salina.1